MSYETNPKKSAKARRVRHELKVLGELPRGRGIRNYRGYQQDLCKNDGCNKVRAHGSSRCKEHSNNSNQ